MGPRITMVRMPATTASRSECRTSICWPGARMASRARAVVMSHLFYGRPAQQAAGSEDQHQHQDAEGEDVFVVAADIARKQGFKNAEQQPAQHGSRQRADAAQHGGADGFDADDEADEE